MTSLALPPIALAETDAEINRCFPVMHELRPHLVEPQFLERIRQQQQSGYQLAYLERDRQIEAVAGFRISQNLAWGKFLYVDDLVTRSQLHAQGCGGALFDWLVEYARTHTCEQLHLDSGVQRFVAHRFYIKKRMYISSHHFSMHLVD